MIRELPKRDLRGAEDPPKLPKPISYNFVREQQICDGKRKKSSPTVKPLQPGKLPGTHITGRAKWKTEIYETRISILRLFGIHRLLSQSAFSCFLLLLKSFESELFCIDGTNVRSDILICPPLPFPPCHDDPILNKKRLGAYISERVAAHIWLFTYIACVRLRVCTGVAGEAAFNARRPDKSRI